MSSITEFLFKQIQDDLRRQKEFTEELLNDLYGLFGDQLCQALSLLDDGSIIKLRNPSHLGLWRVKDKSKPNSAEHCLSTGLCTCTEFRIDALIADKMLWCDHLLAVKLAIALEDFEEEELELEEFQELCRRLDL